MLSEAAVQAVCQGRHEDPFAVLGPHTAPHSGLWVRAFMPGATAAVVVSGAGARNPSC